MHSNANVGFLFIMETERLFFRRYSSAHKSYLIDLFTDPQVMKYVGEGVMTEAQAEEWWSKLFAKFYPQNLQIWAVFTKVDSHYVGHAGIYPRPMSKNDWEFVYFLKKDYWGKGYATEIARRIVEYGFTELNLTEVFTSVDDEHAASIRVMEKAGLVFRRFEFDDEGRFSVYSIRQDGD